MNNHLMSSTVGVNGIFRCKLITAVNASDIRVFVPGINDINPFNSDGSLNLEVYANHMNTFPKVQWCCYNTNSKELLNQDKICWCMFENGDFKKPVVISHAIIGGLSSNVEILSESNQSNGGAGTLKQWVVSISSAGYAWPAPGYQRITSYFGTRFHPILKVNKLHTGIDIAAPSGASVVAAADGTVITSGYSSGYGNHIIIDHGGGISTLYGHHSSNVVAKGVNVTQGQKIAEVGSTGWSTGPHLHFEVQENGVPVNPLNYVTTS